MGEIDDLKQKIKDYQKDLGNCQTKHINELSNEKQKENEMPFNTLRMAFRWKKDIQDLQDRLDDYKRRMSRLRDLWANLAPRAASKPAPAAPKPIKYKAVKGDLVDELMAKALAACNC